MGKYRRRLPQLAGTLFLTDGGLETTLIFHDGIELPYFAAFDLLKSDKGRATLRRYFDRYVAVAEARGVGLVLETPTWRANADWAAKLGYDTASLAEANRRGVDLLLDVRRGHETPATPIVISGNVGPRGDGYVADRRMTAAEAAAYHGVQIATFAQSDADMCAAFTMNYVDEAIGVARVAQVHSMPIAISFTVETNGRLPSGMTLHDAIAATDDATSGGPAYYMINCAHPTHFDAVIGDDPQLRERVRGLRANASKRSHAELDASPDLDAGDPRELGAQYGALRTQLPKLTIVGGCCGTDHRHVDAMGAALMA
jgi:S-methylmethionine-dependent homocysteine/selenocysteine methylase